MAVILVYLPGCSGSNSAGNSSVLNTTNGSITGLVSNKNNAAFEGLTVRLYSSSGNAYDPFVTRTDSNGQYCFTGVPVGDYYVGIDGYDGAKQLASVSAGNTSTVSQITVTSNVNFTDIILCSGNYHFREGVSNELGIYAEVRLVDNNNMPINSTPPTLTRPDGKPIVMAEVGSGNGKYNLWDRPLDRGEYTFSLDGSPSVKRTYFCEDLLPYPTAVVIVPNPVDLTQPFTVSWAAVPDAQFYRVDIYRLDNIVVGFQSDPVLATTYQVPANAMTLPFSEYIVIRVVAFGSNINPMTSVSQITKSSLTEITVSVQP